VQASRYREQFLIGSIQGYADTVPMDRRFQTITGTPLSQYLSGQAAPQQGQPSAGQPGTVTGPAATMLGQPGAQVAPRETAGEILGTPTAEKPLQDRLVPAAAGPQPQAGSSQTQTVQNPFLNGPRSPARGQTSDISPDYLRTLSPDQLMERNAPYVKPSPGGAYLTPLLPNQEAEFQAWVKSHNVPFDPSPKADYDMRGFWQATQNKESGTGTSVNPNDNKLHFPDKWKTPYHMSFSRESQWAKDNAPTWNDKDQLVLHGGRVVFDERAKGQQAEGQADAWTSEGMQPAHAPQSAPQSMDLSPSDRDRLIRTVATEAANPNEQAAIASVLRNRLQAGGWYGNNVTAVTRPNQFEVWSNGRAASVRQDSPEYKTATAAVDGVFGGTAQDQTGGATHFYSPKSQDALGRKAPDWASTFTNKGTIGDTAFYQDPKSAGAGGQLIYQPPIKHIADAGLPSSGRMTGVQGLVIHHTAGGGGPDGVLSTFRERGVSAQYIMDRDGQIYRAVPEGTAANHILTSYGERQGFSNKNVEGIEVIARNNNDWTPEQKQAIQQFTQWHQQKYGYDPQNVLGHGEVNPGRKEADEGFQGVQPWRQANAGGERPQPGQQRYQLAQAPSSGAPAATDAGYGNNSEPVWNGIKLPRQIDGPLNYMSMPDRMKLLDRTMTEVHKRNGEMYQQTLTDVKRDIDEISAGGTPRAAPDGTTSLARAKAIVDPKDYEAHLAKWNSAERQRDMLRPLSNMSESDWDAHKQQFDGMPAVHGQRAIDESFENMKDKFRAQRAADPAAAVSPSRERGTLEGGTDEVRNYLHDMATPRMIQQLDGSYVQAPPPSPQEFTQGLVRARLAAQTRWDIDPTEQRIISQSEAQNLLKLGANNRDISQIPTTDLMRRVQSAADRAEIVYGPQYAKRAVEESIGYLIRKEEQLTDIAPIVAKMVAGQPVSRDMIRALDMAHTLDPMAKMRATFDGKPVDPTVLSARPDASLALPAAAVTPDMTQPTKQQIEFIRQNPDKWRIIDRELGAGTTARVLRPLVGRRDDIGFNTNTAPVPPPVTPGFGQGLKNLFGQSPEAARFVGQPAGDVLPSELPGLPYRALAEARKLGRSTSQPPDAMEAGQ
jgi:N-acetyl-anhydromuramyl-L-alanine amidase AmpD/spore germination cell wall hydrolase CwlJ-like protein